MSGKLTVPTKYLNASEKTSFHNLVNALTSASARALFSKSRDFLFRLGRIHLWLIFTPLLQGVVFLISSPVTLIVALWGMTGERTLQVMDNYTPQMHALVDRRHKMSDSSE